VGARVVGATVGGSGEAVGSVGAAVVGANVFAVADAEHARMTRYGKTAPGVCLAGSVGLPETTLEGSIVYCHMR
jgi:hypothetical protein